ncbi:MAG: carboxypeptidase-like regulatory domain-containing protein, partial [Segetibacter sp.]
MAVHFFYFIFCFHRQCTTSNCKRSCSIDDSNQPLQGVTVQVKGTTNTTATDTKGSFELRNVSPSDSISFSSIGFQNQTFAVKNRSLLTINLQTEASPLEQVVVVGYGTRKRRDVTGAITQVDANAFKFRSTTQFTEMLAGTVAGFNSNQSTFARGGASMEIRGRTSSSAGTTPLIVVDGAIFYGSLLDINSNDIETINILKDASSAAIFGAKATSLNLGVDIG